MASLTAVSVIARTGAHGVPDFISRGIVSPVRGSLKGAKGRFCFVSSLACGLRRTTQFRQSRLPCAAGNFSLVPCDQEQDLPVDRRHGSR